MQPIRRMAFILLKQTWRNYAQPSFEKINHSYLTHTANDEKNLKHLISIVTSLVPNKSRPLHERI